MYRYLNMKTHWDMRFWSYHTQPYLNILNVLKKVLHATFSPKTMVPRQTFQGSPRGPTKASSGFKSETLFMDRMVTNKSEWKRS